MNSLGQLSPDSVDTTGRDGIDVSKCPDGRVFLQAHGSLSDELTAAAAKLGTTPGALLQDAVAIAIGGDSAKRASGRGAVVKTPLGVTHMINLGANAPQTLNSEPPAGSAAANPSGIVGERVLIGKKQAANRYSVSVRQIDVWRERGMPWISVGPRKVLIPVAGADEWLMGMMVKRTRRPSEYRPRVGPAAH